MYIEVLLEQNGQVISVIEYYPKYNPNSSFVASRYKYNFIAWIERGTSLV